MCKSAAHVYRGPLPVVWHIGRHISKVQLIRIWYTMLEDFIIKYWWGAMGMIITALPVFFEVGAAAQRGESVGGRTQGPQQRCW